MTWRLALLQGSYLGVLQISPKPPELAVTGREARRLVEELSLGLGEPPHLGILIGKNRG